MNWEIFDQGFTINQLGSENGIIIRDEVFPDYSRITLEKDTPTAPFAITCGIFDWLVHTRYFASQKQADSEFELMKKELTRIVMLFSDAKDESRNITLECKKFVELFP
jgi:hypothetical protein